MSDRSQAAIEHLRDRLEAKFGVSITYRRGSDTVALTATVGTELLRITESDGRVRTLRTERDYLITAADLVINSAVTTPARGDLIDETIAGVTKRFTVLSPGGQEPAWRYSDRRRVRLRVHTKEVNT